MKTIAIHGLVYEVYDTAPQGYSPDRTAGTPLGKYTLYNNQVPRYLFDQGIVNPAFRRALVREVKEEIKEEVKEEVKET